MSEDAMTDFTAVRTRLEQMLPGLPFSEDIQRVLAEVDRLTGLLETHTVAFLTPYEVVDRLRVSKMTVYRLIERGELPAIRIGHHYRIPAPGFDAYLASRPGQAVADDA